LTQGQEKIRQRIVAAMGDRVSANALSKASGVDRRTIDRLKAGERFPGPDKVIALARALELDLKGDMPDLLLSAEAPPKGDTFSLVGFLNFVRTSGMEQWASLAEKGPTLAEAWEAATRIKNEPQLSRSDGAPIEGWSKFFADLRSGIPRVQPSAKASSTTAAKAAIGDPSKHTELTRDPPSATTSKKRSSI
jgi:transcriptional regulator with XRE-family HTH domain